MGGQQQRLQSPLYPPQPPLQRRGQAQGGEVYNCGGGVLRGQ
eukprot:CAMPEP_0173175204 /NCGR_PEP_ID=MMETSP1141-20130122/3775_1 /TAXON_ID=483371 /ORGANISM="non described non described, Strain CCMP2298" /LENGTH=41 /DNA_ID= /DNA_START= /DNA_END= /DNA_ORIENTATION=